MGWRLPPLVGALEAGDVVDLNALVPVDVTRAVDTAHVLGAELDFVSQGLHHCMVERVVVGRADVEQEASHHDRVAGVHESVGLNVAGVEALGDGVEDEQVVRPQAVAGENAMSLASRVAAGGTLLLSGIWGEAQAAEVEAAFAPDFEGFERSWQDGWVVISARRRR